MSMFRPVFHRARALIGALALASAAAFGQGSAPGSAPADATASAASEVEPSGLTAELFFRLMAADVAAQRGEEVAAAREFLKIAQETRSAPIARRATETALAARAYPLANEAVALWLQLEPGSERALRIASALRATTGSLADVKEHLARMIADEPNKGAGTPETFMQLNRMLSGQQDRLGAFRLVNELAAPYPQLPEAHYAVAAAGLATGLGDTDVAGRSLAAADRALELRPGWDRAAVLRAQILSRRSPDEGLAWLRAFTQAHPEARGVRAAYAQVLVEQRKYAEARAEFQRLWDEDRAALEIRYALAVVAVQMRDYAAAEQHFLALKEADYGEPGAVESNLASIAEETKRYELALERYREVEPGERWWTAQLRIAVMLGRLGRIDEANKHLESLSPNAVGQSVQVKQTQAQVLRDAGRNAEAYALLAGALGTWPDNQDLLYDLAMVAEKLDRIDEAEKGLRRLLELAPESAHTLNALGYTLVDRTDRIREGFELIERAHRLAPHDPFILDSLGWAYFRLGRLDESETYLRRALAERPDPEIAAHLGEVLWTRGQREQAREIWQSQLKDAPDHPVLLDTIRRLER
jgi:tetratricopeptide (TPR) repeat protein